MGIRREIAIAMQTRLFSIAGRIANGDSLAEIFEGLLDARDAFVTAAASGGQVSAAAQRFIAALIPSFTWERFGIDAGDPKQVLTAYRRSIARGVPAEWTSKHLTADELAAPPCGYRRRVISGHRQTVLC
jgi:hypothetical protein